MTKCWWLRSKVYTTRYIKTGLILCRYLGSDFIFPNTLTITSATWGYHTYSSKQSGVFSTCENKDYLNTSIWIFKIDIGIIKKQATLLSRTPTHDTSYQAAYLTTPIFFTPTNQFLNQWNHQLNRSTGSGLHEILFLHSSLYSAVFWNLRVNVTH